MMRYIGLNGYRVHSNKTSGAVPKRAHGYNKTLAVAIRLGRDR